MSQKEFYKIFKPQLSPQKMLELGFLAERIFQMEVLKISKILKSKNSKVFDVNLNFFKINRLV